MNDPLDNNEEGVIGNTGDKGSENNSLNFFSNIINNLNLKKINQPNTIFIVMISIYFFVFILLACINPVSLKGFNYSAYLQVGLVALLLYGSFFLVIGNVKQVNRKTKKKRK